jgi:putative membrane protein
MGFGFGGLFWVLVIAAIAFWVARRGRMPWFDVPFGTQGAMNILRERYAKGEISAEEFDERRKKLSD